MIAMGNALTAVIVIDGKVAGTWRKTTKKRSVEIEVSPFPENRHRSAGGAGSRGCKVREVWGDACEGCVGRMMRRHSDEDTDIIPDYLDQNTKAMLRTAQEAAKEAGLRSEDLIQEGADTWWFTWTGSAKHRTILALGLYFSGLKTEDHTIAIKFLGITPKEVKQKYCVKYLLKCHHLLKSLRITLIGFLKNMMNISPKEFKLHHMHTSRLTLG